MADDTMPEAGFFDKHRDKIVFAGPDECWLWTASRNHNGYGRVRVRGKVRRTHREAYEDQNGEGSAGGLVVRHKCDMPACVNPDHLELGTVADNNRDMMERGRNAQPKGEAHGRAKLTDDDVRTIRAVYTPGSRTQGQFAIARRFGVNRSLIGQIVRREVWAHIL